jgi:hypothetical protein
MHRGAMVYVLDIGSFGEASDRLHARVPKWP